MMIGNQIVEGSNQQCPRQLELVRRVVARVLTVPTIFHDLASRHSQPCIPRYLPVIQPRNGPWDTSRAPMNHNHYNHHHHNQSKKKTTTNGLTVRFFFESHDTVGLDEIRYRVYQYSKL